MIKYTYATPGDAKEIIRTMRREIDFESDDGLALLMQRMSESHQVYCAWVDRQLLAMFGFQSESLLSGAVYVWAITTDLIDQYPIIFLRHSRTLRDELLKTHSRIVVDVSCSFTKSQRWVRWLGFDQANVFESAIRYEMKRA